MEHIATDQKLQVTTADTVETTRSKAVEALLLNAKADGSSDVPALRVLRIVLGLSETAARDLANALRSAIYKNRGGSRRGYQLLEHVLSQNLTPEQARTSITRYFLSLPIKRRKLQVQGVLPSDSDAVSILAEKTGISRELALEALRLMQHQGLVAMHQDSDGWVDLIRWK